MTIFAESLARPLLVVHAVVAVAAVGSASHTLLWMRMHLRTGGKLRALRRFAALTFALYLLTFVVGLFIYPTYRTRVRAEFLDEPAAIAAQVDAARAARALRSPVQSDAREAEVASTVERAATAARWFDVKEYLALIGLLAAAALAMVLRAWEPAAREAIGGIVLGLAVVVAATGWLAGLLGILTVTWRGL